MVEKTIIEEAGQDYNALTPEARAAVLAQVEQEHPGTRAFVENEVNTNFQEAVVVETYNGIMVIPTDDPMIFANGSNGIEEVSVDQAFLAKLYAAHGYLNVYIFNGMGAVLSLEDSTLSVAERAEFYDLNS